MTDLDALASAVADDPTAAWGLRDALVEAGRWDYENVLAVVLRHPRSDGPRHLAIAWFDHAGDRRRAEFVRLQLEHYHLPEPEYKTVRPFSIPDAADHPAGRCAACVRTLPAPCRYHEIQSAMGGLIRGTERGQWSNFPPAMWGKYPALFGARLNPGWLFRRGFVEYVRCPWSAWAEFGDDCVAAQPVWEVEATGDPSADDSVVESVRWFSPVVVTAAVAGRVVSVDVPDTRTGIRWTTDGMRNGAFRAAILAARWPGVAFRFTGAWNVPDPQPETEFRVSPDVDVSHPFHVGDLVYPGPEPGTVVRYNTYPSSVNIPAVGVAVCRSWRDANGEQWVRVRTAGTIESDPDPLDADDWLDEFVE